MSPLQMNVCVLACLVCMAASLSPVANEFPYLPFRNIRVLDGRWLFAWLPSTVDPTTYDPSTVTDPTGVITVPSAMDALQPIPGNRASALFRTYVYTTPNSFARLNFQGCGFYCSVWVTCAESGVTTNVGSHSFAYAAFWTDSIPACASAVQRVDVIVDNQFNQTRALLHSENYDFYQYGGIHRTVEWHDLTAVSIQATDVLMRDASKGIVDLRVRLHLLKQGSTVVVPPPTSLTIAVQFDSSTVNKYTVPIDSNGIGLVTSLTVASPTLWSPSTPSLHLVSVSALNSSYGQSNSTETLIERFGLRTVSVCSVGTNSSAVCINGVPTKLLGFSRHDSHLTFGNSLPHVQQLEDLNIVKSLGGNYLRLVHYPHDRRTLSLADELGVLLWQGKPERLHNMSCTDRPT
jgi:beta-galactosidase/beta-glucuronidase